MAKKVTKKTVTETIEEDGSKKTVVKEHAPKTTPNKSRSRKRRKPATQKKPQPVNDRSYEEREKLLIENFVGLQHAMTNMSIKFGVLSDNISKLLQVFEEAAKGFVVGDKIDDEQMLDKIDSLLDQNKTIAKGLVLMEEKVRTRIEHSEEAENIAKEADKFSTQPIISTGESKPMRKPSFMPLSGEPRSFSNERSQERGEGFSGNMRSSGFSESSFGNDSKSDSSSFPKPKPLPSL